MNTQLYRATKTEAMRCFELRIKENWPEWTLVEKVGEVKENGFIMVQEYIPVHDSFSPVNFQ
jgi:hypothetical protein